MNDQNNIWATKKLNRQLHKSLIIYIYIIIAEKTLNISIFNFLILDFVLISYLSIVAFIFKNTTAANKTVNRPRDKRVYF